MNETLKPKAETMQTNSLINRKRALSPIYYRYSLLSIAVLLVCNAMKAQQLPAPYNVSDVNNIVEWAPTSPQNGSGAFSLMALREVKQTTRFFDGLGRPVQTVLKKGSFPTDSSNSGKDFVTAFIYDPFGREALKFLPFVANNNGGNTSISDGNFKVNPFQQQKAFYEDPNGVLKGQFGETWFYGQTDFEASPLNRVEKQMPAGISWVGATRGTELKYWHNTVTDDIKKWVVTDVPGSWGTYSVSGAYPANELYKSVTVDEHGKQMIEFKDKGGKVILKKVQLTATADNGSGSGHDNWLCTYFIYDGVNNLRCVIQPQGVKDLILAGWSFTTPLLNEQCFRYEYDGKDLMIMKRIPGAGDVYMIYDARDRLVMTQDANMRSGNKWLVTKYDVLNRPNESGLWIDATNVATHRANASASTSYPVTSSNYELYGVIHYDDYLNLPGGLPAGMDGNYDNSFSIHLNNAYNTAPDYPVQPVKLAQPNGLVTWVQTKVLGTPNTFLTSINIYDANGRIIQVKATNVTGNMDIVTSQYNWPGQPLITVSYQNKGQSPVQTTTTVTKMTYDDLGRVRRTEKKLGNTLVNANAMSSYKVIAENEYDALGRMNKKKLAPAYNSNAGLETQNFEYNIRGWLLGMNREYAKANNNSNYFGFDLGYDKASNQIIGGASYATPQFNGNISGTVWRSKGDGEDRKYDFTYDAANRLLTADFNQYTTGTFNKTANVDFSVNNISYDANGNLLSMNQKGLKLNNSSIIDQLTYSYQGNSNKLSKVTDVMSDPLTNLGDFKDGTNGAADDYTYDANGNLTLDHNKAISSITYNHINLPSVVTVTGKGTITYTYDATGNKLKKVTQETSTSIPYNGTNYTTSVTTTTLYLGNAVYESKSYSNVSLASLQYTDQLLYLAHEEGRIRFAKASTSTCPASQDRFVFDYYIRDHIGNVRAVLTEQKEDICYIPATVEDASYQVEDDIYAIVNGRRIDKTTTGATQSSFGNKLYRTHGNLANEKSGLGVVLKVMNGDQVKITAESYYTMPGGGPGSTLSLGLTELLTSLVNSSAVTSGHAGISTTDVSNAGTNNTTITNFINNSNPGSNTARAFVSWILFDEQFKFVTGDVDPVQTNGGYKLHTKFINAPVNVTKSGYLYIYVSNENNLPVYFDNLGITHTPGPLLEETHYYPFGLAMKGISSKALAFGNAQNKRKYKGKELQNEEFTDRSGLEWTDFGARMYDQQIGRWHVVDPLADTYNDVSPYAFVKNNPINNIEIDGRYFEGKDKKKSARIERRAERKADRLVLKAARMERRGENSGDLRSRATQLKSSAQDIRDMRDDKSFQYRYKSLGSKEARKQGLKGPGTQRSGFNDKGDLVVTMFVQGRMGSKLHEGKHGGQVSRGEYSIVDFSKYGVHDEVEAYRAEFSWNGRLDYRDDPDVEVMEARVRAKKEGASLDITRVTITKFSDITPGVVNSMVEKGPNGRVQTIYPPKKSDGTNAIDINVWNNN